MASGCDLGTPIRHQIATKSSKSLQARFRLYKNTLRQRILPDVVSKTCQSSDFVQLNQRPLYKSPVTDLASNPQRQPIHANSFGIMGSDSVDDKISPGLARLRMTPGALREKQRHLMDQHDAIRQKGDQLMTGGGISLWPEMIQMRLKHSEVLWLSVQAVVLCILTVQLLKTLHGATFSDLQGFSQQVHQFCGTLKITDVMNQTQFQSHITEWHGHLLALTESIQKHFDMTAMSTSYQLAIATYLLGLAVLLYYLLDNILAKNKLTPSRIKKWTCLLVVIGTWTGMMAYGLYCACLLEWQIVRCIQQYSSSLAFLVTRPLNLNLYQAVLLYWRSRFLDTASQGLLSVLGLITVKDLVYYLQFYSVPIVTVIISPVVKLCCACLTVYGQGKYFRIQA